MKKYRTRRKRYFRFYLIEDPRGSPRCYIGFTTQTLERRLVNHLRKCNPRSRRPLHMWIQSLRADRVSPRIRLLDEFPAPPFRGRRRRDNRWSPFERFWIALYRANHRFIVLNVAAGGRRKRKR